MRPIKHPAGKHPPGGVVAITCAQALAGLVQVPVDSVLGKTQLASDLLGAHVAIDQRQAFALTLRETVQPFDRVCQ